MGLREIRKSRNITQKELAKRSGVNFRSLQDYEQGHKKLSSASGDIIMRLSTVLGCTAEDLLLEDIDLDGQDEMLLTVFRANSQLGTLMLINETPEGLQTVSRVFMENNSTGFPVLVFVILSETKWSRRIRFYGGRILRLRAMPSAQDDRLSDHLHP